MMPKYAKDKPTPEARLMQAAAIGDLESVIRLLLRKRININKALGSNDETALHMAARNGQAEVVARLIKAGAYVDAKNRYGNTALILASMYGHEEVVDILLNAGANVEAKNSKKATALIFARESGHEGVVNLLTGAKDTATKEFRRALEAGDAEKVAALLPSVDVNKTIGFKKESALLRAAWHGHTAVVDLLLKAGANLDAVNIHGTTALIAAASRGQLQVVMQLLAAGAAVHFKNAYGYTALSMAQSGGYKEIVKLLSDVSMPSSVSHYKPATILSPPVALCVQAEKPLLQLLIENSPFPLLYYLKQLKLEKTRAPLPYSL